VWTSREDMSQKWGNWGIVLIKLLVTVTARRYLTSTIVRLNRELKEEGINDTSSKVISN